VARAYGVDIGEIHILAFSDDTRTRLRLEGVGWADYDGCYAAIQVVPWPDSGLGSPADS
jgi:hypothetical protein